MRHWAELFKKQHWGGAKNKITSAGVNWSGVRESGKKKGEILNGKENSGVRIIKQQNTSSAVKKRGAEGGR